MIAMQEIKYLQQNPAYRPAMKAFTRGIRWVPLVFDPILGK